MFSNKTTNEIPIGEGLFRKQGSNVKSWKVRKYSLLSSYQLQYSDALTCQVKGSMSISNVSLREGARENAKNSGAPKEAFAMDICSFDDSRTLEVVFDTVADAKAFLQLLYKCSRKQNIAAFCSSQGWTELTFAAPDKVESTRASTVPRSSIMVTSPSVTASDSATSSDAVVPINTSDEGGIIGSGNFRKQGSNVKNWKVRKYYIRRDGSLIYVDPAGGTMKGTMSVKFIELYPGNAKNIEESGCTVLMEGDSGYALDLHIIEGQRKLEVVFDSVIDAKRFVEYLSMVSTSNNIKAFLNMTNWGSFKTEGKADVSSPVLKVVPARGSLPGGSDLAIQINEDVVLPSLYEKWKQALNSSIIIYSKSRHPANVVVYEGVFRLFTLGILGWKERQFSVYDNGIMKYYEGTVEKGTLNINHVMIALGNPDNVDTSGSADFSLENGLPIDLITFSSIIDYETAIDTFTTAGVRSLSDKSKMQLVFDTAMGAKQFLEAVSKSAIRNNVRAFVTSIHWTIMKNPDDHVEFSSTNSPAPAAESVVEEEFDFEGGTNMLEDGKEGAAEGVSETPEKAKRRNSLLQKMAKEAGYNVSAFADETVNAVGNVATATANAVGSVATSTVHAVGTVASTAGNVAVIAATAMTNVVLDKNINRPNDSKETIVVLGEGLFRKQGSNVKSWKVRKYVITSDSVLWYYDNSGVLKGNMCVKNIRVGDGSHDAITSSGIPSTSQSRAMSLNVKSLSDNRILEVVLETEGQCKWFVQQLNMASQSSNIISYVSKTGWDLKSFEKKVAGSTPAAASVTTSASAHVPAGAAAGAHAAHEDKAGSRLSVVAPSGANSSTVAPASAPAASTPGTYTPVTYNTNAELVFGILNNILIICQLLVKRLQVQDRPTGVILVVWSCTLLYIWRRPSLLRVLCFLAYNYGIYVIIINHIHATQNPHAAAIQTPQLSRPAPEAPVAAIKSDQNRNWNLNKKTQ